MPTSDDVNIALDKIEQLLSEDEQLLKKMEGRRRLNSPKSAKNTSRSLAIQSSSIVNRVNKIESIMQDHKSKEASASITRIDDHVLGQKTIQQLDQIRSNMIDRPLLPNPLQFHQVFGRHKGDNDHYKDSARYRESARADNYHQLLQRKERQISLLARQNEAALSLKKQWQQATEDARLELAQLERWIEELVPLNIELLNRSTDTSLHSAREQVLHLLEQPKCIDEGMGEYIDKKMNSISSMLSGKSDRID